MLKVQYGLLKSRVQCMNGNWLDVTKDLSSVVKSQYKYHTVLSLRAKTIVTCVRIFWEVKAELGFFWRHNNDMVSGRG